MQDVIPFCSKQVCKTRTVDFTDNRRQYYCISDVPVALTKYVLRPVRNHSLTVSVFPYSGLQVYNYSMVVDDIHEHLTTHEESNFTTIMTKISYAQLLFVADMLNFTYVLFI